MSGDVAEDHREGRQAQKMDAQWIKKLDDTIQHVYEVKVKEVVGPGCRRG